MVLNLKKLYNFQKFTTSSVLRESIYIIKFKLIKEGLFMRKISTSILAASFAALMFSGTLFAEDILPLSSLDTDTIAPNTESSAPALATTQKNAPALATTQKNAPALATTQKNAPALATTQKNAPGLTVAQKKQQTNFTDMLILYFPNRAMDALDMIDISLGFGPAVKAKLWATRYLSFGGGVGGTAKVIKGYNRQYGTGLESGWSGAFMMLTAENTEMYSTTRGVQSYFERCDGIPSLNDSVYNFWRGPRDMFSIGAELALFGEVDVEVHPFEIIDFVAGIFFLDPKGDDITMSDIDG